MYEAKFCCSYSEREKGFSKEKGWPFLASISVVSNQEDGDFGCRRDGSSEKSEPKQSPLTLITTLPICLFILPSPQISTKLLYSLLYETHLLPDNADKPK